MHIKWSRRVYAVYIPLKKTWWTIVLHYVSRYCFLKWKALRYHNICALFLFFSVSEILWKPCCHPAGQVFVSCSWGRAGVLLGHMEVCWGCKALVGQNSKTVQQRGSQNCYRLVPTVFWESPWHGLFLKLCTGTVWEPLAGTSQNHAGGSVSN